ncbi:MAG TPA: cobalamin biosynthesis protein [Polyangiaceae bacterium]|nr:cobalamin biosynthesis protein [Polyangiaceae bacterium]
MIAAGLGCRAGCPVEHVLAALEQALAAGGCVLEQLSGLYTAQFKHAEPALLLAAERLSKPLVVLPLAELQAQSSKALSCSAHSLERFGVPSIAETAALAGAARAASPGEPRLIGTRSIAGSATCALAIDTRGGGGAP